MLIVGYMNDIAYQFRLPTSLHLEAKHRAESEGMTLSVWMRRLVIAALQVPHGTPVSGPTLAPVKPEPVKAPIPTMKVIKSPTEALERIKSKVKSDQPVRRNAFDAYQ